MSVRCAKKQGIIFHLKWNGQGRDAGVLGLPAHRQQALGWDALVRHDAEELAGRHAGVVHQLFQAAASGKPLTQFPGTDRGDRKTQVLGNLLQGDVVLPSPRAERGRKAGPDVTMKMRLLGHGKSVREIRLGVKRAKAGNGGRSGLHKGGTKHFHKLPPSAPAGPSSRQPAFRSRVPPEGNAPRIRDFRLRFQD